MLKLCAVSLDDHRIADFLRLQNRFPRVFGRPVARHRNAIGRKQFFGFGFRHGLTSFGSHTANQNVRV